MKTKIFVLILFCVLYSCSDKKNATTVTICAEGKEINLNEIFKAKIYFVNKDSIYPKFFILDKNDTLQLYYKNDEGYALFEAVGTRIGKRVYEGFVEYSINGQVVKEPFEISYTVKP